MTAMSPVLVSGCPRTGTTWLGRMLTLSGELGELYEPFNPRAHRARWFDPAHHYLHVDDTNDGAVAGPVSQLAALRYPLGARVVRARSTTDLRRAVSTWRMVAGHRRAQRAPLIKDPLALFATPWLAQRFDFRPVLIVRHPAGFVTSMLRVGWSVNFQSFLRQHRLMESLLAPWRAEIEAAAERPRDPLGDAALLWTLCTGTIQRYRIDHPEWIVVRHEDLASDPVGRFEDLYRRLSLRWSDAVAAEVAAGSNENNPEAATGRVQHELVRDSRAIVGQWRSRLDAAQVAEVRDITGGVADVFYGADDW